MSDINNQICDAISIIVDKRLSQANFDKTIQATIVAQGDKTKGEYKVKYLDSSFYAYDKSGKDYAVGTQVYVLVPENDLSKVKTILGTADKTKDIQPIVPEGNKFEYLTNNLFIIEPVNTEFGIKSWLRSSKEIYNRTEDIINKYTNNATFTIDTDGLSYIEKEGFDYFILKCNVRTNLQKSQQHGGNYGIRVALTADLKENQQNAELESPDSTDNTLTDQKTENIILDFVLDSTMMVGNPYSLVIPTAQIAGFNIGNYKNIIITNISLFSENFDDLEDSEKDEGNNIFFTDLSLQCANKISADNLNGNYLYISVPEGQYFSEQNKKESITLKAIFQSKGQIIDPAKYSGLTYYWFKKNPQITVKSDKYCKINGINTVGWECLNPEDKENNTFKAGGDTYTVTKNSFLSNQQEYRCIALFDNLAYSKTKIVYNKNPQYIISLTSDSGTIFYNNNGQPKLTCGCRKFTTNGAKVISADYYWYSTNIDDQRKSLGNEENKQLSTQLISINQYPDKAIIDCAVVKYDDKTFIGVGTLELLNLKSDTIMPYNLTINNGSQMFKYNTLGVSPIHSSSTNSNVEPSQKEINAVLQPLSFTLVNNKTGEEFTEGTSQKWILPPDNETMFDFSALKEKLQDYNKEGYEGYKIYEGETSLSFSIKNKYDYTKINNTILLEVVKENQTYVAKTNILFVKEGDNGTNGTDYVCQIVGLLNGKEISFSEGIPYYYYNKDSGNKFYYNQQSINNQLKLKIFKNGENIEIGDSQITWSLLKSPFFKNKDNTYTSTRNYPCILAVNNSGQIIEDESYKNLSDIEKKDIANIIIVKAECSFKDANNKKLIYATLPIGIILNNSEIDNNYIKKQSGFYYVIYDADGTNPSYDNTDTGIFEIVPILAAPKGKQYIFKWEPIGEQLYLQKVKEKDKDNNEMIVPIKIKAIAKEPLIAENISNGISCKIYIVDKSNIQYDKNGEVITEGLSPIHQTIIPIHLYTNRFGHAAINGWDGNTVSIDTEGGVVLAPQIGAGFKDENNAFTGVLMGTSLLKDHDKSTTDKDVYLKETGLMGLHNGKRSFFLKSEDGSAVFGKNGSGQIKIIPKDNQAIIEGGKYQELTSTEEGSGMQINLSAPSITYGNKKFSVDKNGILTCTDANVNGWFSATQTLRDGANYQHYELTFTNKKSNILMQSGTINGKQKKFEEILLKPGFFRVGSSTGQIPVIENKEQQEIYDLLVQNGIIFSQENNIIITNIDELISSSSEENVDNLINIKNRFFSNDSTENLNQDILTLFYQVQERDNNIESIYDDDIDNIENQEDSTYLKYSQGKVSLKGNFHNSFKNEDTSKQEISIGSTSFSDKGIKLQYEKHPTILKVPEKDEENKKYGHYFNLNDQGFSFYKFKTIKPVDKSVDVFDTSVPDYETIYLQSKNDNNNKLESKSQTVQIMNGISYSFTRGLKIVGKLTATSGNIGGWRITDKYIASNNNELVLYSDGRITGAFNKNSYYAGNQQGEDPINNGTLSMESSRTKTSFTSFGVDVQTTKGDIKSKKIFFTRVWHWYTKDTLAMISEAVNGAEGIWEWQDAKDPYNSEPYNDRTRYTAPVLIKRFPVDSHNSASSYPGEDLYKTNLWYEIYEATEISQMTNYAFLGVKQKKQESTKRSASGNELYNDSELEAVSIEAQQQGTPICFSITSDGKMASSTMKFAEPRKKKTPDKTEAASTFSSRVSTSGKVTSDETQYAELSFPYSETKNGKEEEYDGTRISAVKIITGDVEIDKDSKTQMITHSANSLVSAVNEILTPPKRVKYISNGESGNVQDLIIETYEDGTEYTYELKISNKGTDNEEVQSLKRRKTEIKDKNGKIKVIPEYTINLIGF